MPSRRFWCVFLLVCALRSATALLSAHAQTGFNEREVKSSGSAEKSEFWTLDFRFKDPRMIKVDIPGRGKRICWYLWYQVINHTGEPRQCIPHFELVMHDYPTVFLDEVLPAVVKEISKREDPTGYQKIQNSVTISREMIPVSKPPEEAFPRAVTGVAVWDASPADPKDKEAGVRDLSDCTRFTIFIRGLSNGYVVVDPPSPGLPPITRYKTLQLNFRRQGDKFSTDAKDISFVAPAEWIYRASGRKLVDSLK
jgi:hypothetical protein